MTRKKVKLAFITNDSSRKATFKKRKKGLLKKVNELSTLCGINACVIIYSPYDPTPEVWPSNAGVRKVVEEFKSLPEMDREKKMVDQDAFMRLRIDKTIDHVKKFKKENREMEMSQILFQSLEGNIGNYNMNILDLNDLGYMMDQIHQNLTHRIKVVENSGVEIGEPSNDGGASQGNASTMVMASTMAPMAPIREVGSLSAAFYRPVQQHQQFHHLSAPHVGLFEPSQNLDLSLNHNHHQNQQPWHVDMMNNPHQPSNVAEQIGFSFMDHNHQQHQPQPHQQPIGDSTNSDVPSSSNAVPDTNPNITNNVWFH